MGRLLLPSGYSVVDLLAHWKFGRSGRLSVGVFNLLDEKYWQWADVPPIPLEGSTGIPGRGVIFPSVSVIAFKSQNPGDPKNMQNSKDPHDEPSVKLLLSALSWLTSKRRLHPDAATQSAIAHHLRLLVMHPASDTFDIQAALYMASRAGMDTDGLLARFAAAKCH